MVVGGMEAVNADAVAAVFCPGTVPIEAATEIKPYVVATLQGAEENQVTWLEKMQLSHLGGDRLAEPFLLVGIPWNPDALAGERHLDQSGAVHIWFGGPAPEVGIGLLLGRGAPTQDLR